MDTVKSLEEQIAVIDYDMAAARSKIKSLNAEAIVVETNLIGLKLQKEALLEKHRLLESRTVDRNMTDRQKDIADFKVRLPEILLKDK